MNKIRESLNVFIGSPQASEDSVEIISPQCRMSETLVMVLSITNYLQTSVDQCGVSNIFLGYDNDIKYITLKNHISHIHISYISHKISVGLH